MVAGIVATEVHLPFFLLLFSFLDLGLLPVFGAVTQFNERELEL
jgi:hypothetical protein